MSHLSFMASEQVRLKDIFFSLGSWQIKLIKLFDYLVGSVLVRLLKESAIVLSPNITNPQRILIIRPGGIGDAILLIPFLRKLKNTNAAVTVDILCEKRNKQVFASQNDIFDNLYEYTSFSDMRKVFKNTYDVVLDTEQWHYLSALVAYFVKAKYRIGFSTRKQRAKLFNIRVAYGLHEHELNNFRKLFSPILPEAKEVADIDQCYVLADHLIAWASEQLPARSLTLYIGASIIPRRLTHEQSIKLVEYFLARDYTVALIGGSDVTPEAKKIEEGIKDKHLVNFVGRASLNQTAALIKCSQLFIGTDSGIMHLASAVGTSVIAIFGPSDLNKWKPLGNKHFVVTENLPCSPCTKFAYAVPTCRGGYQCMRGLDINKIFEHLNTFFPKKEKDAHEKR